MGLNQGGGSGVKGVHLVQLGNWISRMWGSPAAGFSLIPGFFWSV